MAMKQKTIFKKISVFFVLLSIILISAGCGGGPTAFKATLKIWKPFVDSDQMDVIVQAYAKQQPNVQIEYTKKNIETYESDLLNALASGNGPDIFAINNSWLPSYLDKITPAPEKLYSLKEYKDTFVDVLFQDFVFDNKIYGTALWVDSLGLYYNKDLMGTAGIATPPKTWFELERDVRRLTDQNRTGYFDRSGVAIGTFQNVNRAVDVVYLYMLQAGVAPWSVNSKAPQFTETVTRNGQNVSPGFEAVTFYTSFGNPSSPNYNWNSESDYSIDAFVNGRATYLYGYSYTQKQIDAKAPNLNYDIAPVPQYDLSQPNINYASYFAEVVSKQSKVSEAAWDFLKFATSKEALELYYAKDKQPSSRRDLIALQIQDLEIGVFAHANLTAKSFYKYNEVKFDDIMARMIENIIFRGMNIQNALTRAQSETTALVNQF
jgi:multiple sugar transport system substrate-binding protein